MSSEEPTGSSPQSSQTQNRDYGFVIKDPPWLKRFQTYNTMKVWAWILLILGCGLFVLGLGMLILGKIDGSDFGGFAIFAGLSIAVSCLIGVSAWLFRLIHKGDPWGATGEIPDEIRLRLKL